MNDDNSRTDLAARLDRLEHRAAIADVIYLYARYIRAGNGAACAELFTEDAVFEIKDAPLGNPDATKTRARLEGPDAILQYLTQADGADARVYPMIQNLIVEVSGHKATANSAMTATVLPDGKRIIGEYHDSFQYRDRWRFSSRTFYILGDLDA